MRYIRKYYEICKKTLLTGSNATGSRSHTKIMRPRNYTAWLPQGLVVDRTKHLRTGNMEISWRGILSHWKWVRKTTTIRYTKKKQPRVFSQTQAKPANELQQIIKKLINENPAALTRPTMHISIVSQEHIRRGTLPTPCHFNCDQEKTYKSHRHVFYEKLVTPFFWSPATRRKWSLPFKMRPEEDIWVTPPRLLRK